MQTVQTPSQEALFPKFVAKKCKGCRTRKDSQPVGTFKCEDCGAWITVVEK